MIQADDRITLLTNHRGLYKAPIPLLVIAFLQNLSNKILFLYWKWIGFLCQVPSMGSFGLRFKQGYLCSVKEINNFLTSQDTKILTTSSDLAWLNFVKITPRVNFPISYNFSPSILIMVNFNRAIKQTSVASLAYEHLLQNKFRPPPPQPLPKKGIRKRAKAHCQIYNKEQQLNL